MNAGKSNIIGRGLHRVKRYASTYHIFGLGENLVARVNFYYRKLVEMSSGCPFFGRLANPQREMTRVGDARPFLVLRSVLRRDFAGHK